MSKEILVAVFYDKVGYKGDNLYEGNWYAEINDRLWGLPYRHKLKFTYKGKSVIGMKGDVGLGHPKGPAIEIHTVLAKKIVCPNLSKITIENA